MGMCNANYECTVVNIGDNGRNSDDGVFANSTIGMSLNEGTLNIPGTNLYFPYVFVGDYVFPLKKIS